MTKQELENVMRHYKKREISNEKLIPAAVLIPLFYKDGQCYALFTRRSNEVISHKSQVCFPGGAHQASDADLLQTALREAEEEIGLKSEDVEVLGELDDSITLTGYLISPFIAFIPYPYPFKANNKEVAKIFSIPLSALMDENNFRQAYQTIDGVTYLDYSYKYGEEVVWGATARIVKQFTDLIRRQDS